MSHCLSMLDFYFATLNPSLSTSLLFFVSWLQSDPGACIPVWPAELKCFAKNSNNRVSSDFIFLQLAQYFLIVLLVLPCQSCNLTTKNILLGGQQLVNISLGGGFSELCQRLFCSNHPHPRILFTLIPDRVSVIFSRISFHIFFREESQINFCVFFFTNNDLNYIRTLKPLLIITDYSPAFISRILSTLSSCAALLAFPVMVWRSLFIIWSITIWIHCLSPLALCSVVE